MTESLYVTTAIPFVNARPHLGFALELCIADALARHARARGQRVWFATGTDDHSLKNVLAAERAERTVAELVADNAAAFRQLAAALTVAPDSFVSTSQHPHHAATVQALWRRCLARGDLFKQAYTGLYCVGCERFCEPGETRCAEHSQPPEPVTEENWFFRLSRYRAPLHDAIASQRLRIEPLGAREETLALLREPLPELCVSRSASRARGWGVPVPGDAAQVIWVWFDALAYYLTALGFGSADGARFEQHWQAGAGSQRRLHVIGKGIVRFHALIWPAILRSAGLAWPSELLAHGYLTQAGAKISKSGVALDPLPILADYGSDAVRYYLLRHVRTTRDGDFDPARLAQAYQSELANGLGNLANRLLGLVQRVDAGGVLQPTAASLPDEVQALEAQARALPGAVDEAVRRFALDDALAAIFTLIDASNRSIDRSAPWAVIKRGEQAQARALLGSWLGVLQQIGAELAPFLPLTAARLDAAISGFHEGRALPASLQLFPARERHSD